MKMLIFLNLKGNAKRWLPLKARSTTEKTALESDSPKAGIRSFQSVKQGIFMESFIAQLPFFEKFKLAGDCTRLK